MKSLRLFLFILSLFLFSVPVYAASPGDIVINEIAWMGSLPDEGETTRQASNDEWIELYNTTGSEIILDGWILESSDGTPTISLEGALPANGFFLLERTDDTTVAGIAADQIYTGALKNSGEYLRLLDADSNVIDEISASDGWPAGDNPTKQTMERKNPLLAGSDPANWKTSVGTGGTPGAQNSAYEPTASSPDDPDPPSDQNPEGNEAGPPQSESLGEESEQDPAPNQSPPTDEPDQQVDELFEIEPNATTTLSQSPPNPEEEIGIATTTNDNKGEAPEQIIYPNNIFINEIMPYPIGPDDEGEWIEIFNKNNEQADLSAWQIQDMQGSTKIFTFPEGTIISGKAYLILSRPTTKITLNNDSDGLELIRSDGKIVQTVEFGKATKGKSYSKNKEIWQWTDVPTPGSANIISLITTNSQQTKTNGKKSIGSGTNTESYAKQAQNSDSVLRGDLDDESKGSKSVQRSDNTASIGSSVELGTNPKNNNLIIYIIAPLLALLSAIFIFLLKKRLTNFL